MRRITLYTLLIITVIACEQEQDKVTQLKEAKKELKDLQEKIAKLEEEISSSDTLAAKIASGKAVLVSTIEIEKEKFQHGIEVRGTVKSRRNVMISAETGGTIRRVHVTEGQNVKQGHILVSLDADIIRNNVTTLKTQLELATVIFERQKRLWEQNIGTEIQYLEAKNRKETLEAQLATTNAQLAQAVIKAPFDGVIDEVPAREGELTQPGMPLVRLLNPEQMYIQADVSERFIGRFNKGDNVDIYFPSQKERVTSKISSVSQVINQENRTFSVEINLPKVDFPIRPNQVTVITMQDYINDEAISVPTNIIRKDMSGNYVFLLEKDEENFLIARKKTVKTGVSFKGMTEILEGLTEGDVVIEKGINELTDGAHVQVPAETASATHMASDNN